MFPDTLMLSLVLSGEQEQELLGVDRAISDVEYDVCLSFKPPALNPATQLALV